MTTQAITTGSNGRWLLLGGAIPAVLLGLALLITGLGFVPATQRPSVGIADFGPGFAYFFVLVLVPSGVLILGSVVMSRLPYRPLALIGGYGNFIFGLLWIALMFGYGAYEQDWFAVILGSLPGTLFIFTGLTGLAGWAKRGMVIPGWSAVFWVSGLFLVGVFMFGLVSGMMRRSQRVILIEPSKLAVRGVDWMPASGWLLSGDANGRLQTWPDGQAQTVAQLDEPIFALAVSPEETAVAVTLPKQLILLDSQSWEKMAELSLPDGERPKQISWSPDGRWLAALVTNKTVLVYAAESGELVGRLHTEAGGIGQGIAWSPDSTEIVYAAGGGSLVIWDVATGEERDNWRRNGRMDSVAWSPDGTKIAYYDIRSIQIVDAATGTTLQNHALSTDRDSPLLVWSPDGTLLATGTEKGQIMVLDAVSGEVVLNGREYERPLYTLVWSPDGRELATSGREGSLVVWRID